MLLIVVLPLVLVARVRYRIRLDLQWGNVWTPETILLTLLVFGLVIRAALA